MPPKPVKKATPGKASVKSTASKGATGKSGAKSADKKPAAKPTEAKKEEVVEIHVVPEVIKLTNLPSVVMQDDGNVSKSGKWPLLMDSSGNAATFLKYRDSNCLNALETRDMQPEVIRLALLGAIRFGKFLVVDMMETDMFEMLKEKFNEVEPNLMDMILDKSLIKEEKYLRLLRKSDGQEYAETNFNASFTDNFKFILITSMKDPPKALQAKMYPIKIV